MSRRPGRPKAEETALDRARIVAAALALVDGQGVAALSMRRLGAELGVDPMAIYRHLPDKQALLEAMVAQVFSELRVEGEPASGWQEQVRAFARAYRAMAQAHPNLVLHLVADSAAATQAALLANEALYDALLGAGLPPRLVLLSGDLLIDFLNGFALGERGGALGAPGERRGLRDLLEQQPPDRFPALRRVFAGFSDDTPTVDFEGQLDILLAGITSLKIHRSGAEDAEETAC
ncbi:MAG TPA: TetR/AcrR family transcriptional regulator [Roseiflexaceae bacterium]|nr:TetR/AcrR family transcriptional regulator [Roseiflexaceae bacterium]